MGEATPTERRTQQSGEVGGGRERINPPPRSLFWRFGRFGGLVVVSRDLHAERPEASADSVMLIYFPYDTYLTGQNP
jgi:hypothetical protein